MTPILGRHTTLRHILYYVVVTMCIFFLFGYILFQARFLLIGPKVTFLNAPSVVQTQRVVPLEGTAQNIVKLALNGRPIYTDKNGYFKEALVLENGYTIATLEAYDRYGRKRVYTKQFVYTPAEIREVSK